MQLTTTVLLAGRTATGLPVPADVVAALGPSRAPAVTVTVGAHTYRSTIGSRGGVFLVPLSAENRALAGVAAGDEVQVTLELDTGPRPVEVPVDLAAALDEDPAVRARFDGLSPSGRRRIVLAVDGAKTAPTRQRRISTAVEELRGA